MNAVTLVIGGVVGFRRWSLCGSHCGGDLSVECTLGRALFGEDGFCWKCCMLCVFVDYSARSVLCLCRPLKDVFYDYETETADSAQALEKSKQNQTGESMVVISQGILH